MSSASAALSAPFITSRAGTRLGEPNNVAAIAAAAEGALSIGDTPKAALEARAALAMAPQHVHPGIQRYGRALAARILAWAGDGDAAVDLLEQLSTQYPMKRKLETEIVANQRWRDPD